MKLFKQAADMQTVFNNSDAFFNLTTSMGV